jgi:hypothetical protein
VAPRSPARADDGWTYHGLRSVVLENADLRVLVLTDKGGDIASVVQKPTDLDFLWRSPVGVRDPNARSVRGGSADAAWLSTYEGGWQSLFPNGGWASSYGGLDLGLHDESAVLPWRATVLSSGDDCASIELTTQLVRTPLAARRRLTLHRDSPTLVVEETITNLAAAAFPLSYGQHIVFGPPFLSPACRIDLPGAVVRVHPEQLDETGMLQPDSRSTWPAVTCKDGSERDLRRVPGPDAGTADLLYLGDLADGWYAVTNTDLGVGLAVQFPADLYRYVWQWEVYGGNPGYPWWGRTYSLGLEPFTSATTRGLAAAIEDGSARWIEPGASIESTVRVTPYASRHGIQGVDESGAVTLRTGTDDDEDDHRHE